MKNPKCPECNKSMKPLPHHEPELKKWGGRIGGGTGILRALSIAKASSSLVGVAAHVVFSAASFYVAGRALGKSAGRYIDSLDGRFVCYSCSLIVDEIEPGIATPGALGATPEST